MIKDITSISLIVAFAKHHVIGINNTLPWHLPEDLKRFRALTTGHHIVMGRKTYDSLGRLLPNRTTVIVTRNLNYRVEGAIIAHSLNQAIEACAGDNEVFLIGGAELYKDGLKRANKLYITKLDLDIKGDAYFPDFNLDEWELLSSEQHVSETGLDFNYLVYQRQN